MKILDAVMIVSLFQLHVCYAAQQQVIVSSESEDVEQLRSHLKGRIETYENIIEKYKNIIEEYKNSIEEYNNSIKRYDEMSQNRFEERQKSCQKSYQKHNEMLKQLLENYYQKNNELRKKVLENCENSSRIRQDFWGKFEQQEKQRQELLQVKEKQHQEVLQVKEKQHQELLQVVEQKEKQRQELLQVVEQNKKSMKESVGKLQVFVKACQTMNFYLGQKL
jgi:chromosome segregation ATPase